jgi:hypothetical protein
MTLAGERDEYQRQLCSYRGGARLRRNGLDITDQEIARLEAGLAALDAEIARAAIAQAAA